MKTAAFAALLCLSGASQGAFDGYYRFPTIHGDSIVFSAEGDLWRAPASGGEAMRLTTAPGNEAFARFSPDGKWIAFSGQYGGNVDVYVMPAAGGEPTRLSWHPADDTVVGWTPDSSAVVFSSTRETAHWETYLFEVPIGGGAPTEVKIGIVGTASFGPGGQIAFTRWATESETWNRYRGGVATDLWVGDPAAGRFTKITDYPGPDRQPMWAPGPDGGRIYFTSDRNGRENLFSCRPDGSDIRRHTTHDEYDVRWPDLEAGPGSAGRIVYSYAGDLWILDTVTGKDARVEITLPSDRVRLRPRFENAAKTLDSYELDADGSHLAISSRGELWVSPAKDGRTIQLTHSSGVRERSPVFSPDGKRLAAITDQTGEQEIGLFDVRFTPPQGDDKAPKPAPRGVAAPKILTSRQKGWIFPPVWSPDGASIAYADLTQSLLLVDAATGDTKVVDTSPAWEITEYAFSPDGKWLAYTKPRDQESTSLCIYSLAEGKSYTLTSDFTSDHSPAWDPDGKYLYFISNRTVDPVLDERDFEHIITRTGKVYAAILAADGLSPFAPEELRPPEAKDEEAKADNADAKDEGGDEPEETDGAQPGKSDGPKPKPGAKPDVKAHEPDLTPVKIDSAGLADRIIEFPMDAGNLDSLRAVKGAVFFLSRQTKGMLDQPEDPGPSSEADAELHRLDIEKKKDEVFIDAVKDYTLSADGSKMAYRVADSIEIRPADSKPDPSAEDADKESVDPSALPLEVDPAAEWAQIFAEAWRLQRDFYWAEDMAGIDWPLVRKRYAALLPRISTRNELNDLIGQVISELGTSHTYVWGGDTERGKGLNVGLLGADLEPDAAAGAMRFAHVLRAESWETDTPNPLLATSARITEGDYLWAINGRPCPADETVWGLLAGQAGKQVQLTVGSRADGSDARDIQIEALDDEHTLRYRDWCRRNREYVDQASGGRIGYMHLSDMDAQGLVEFIKFFYPQLKKDGLIIDVRYNGGGFVSQMIIERLARTLWAYQRPRRGATFSYPQRVHQGYKAVLINHWSASDGDIFPASFQIKKLGPIIGTRSWGGVIGIRADKPFIDGGMSSQPEFAWWEPGKGWTIENHGVDPDIVIDNTPADQAAGRDAQLDRAIAEIQKMLAANPIPHPDAPPAPNKWGK